MLKLAFFRWSRYRGSCIGLVTAVENQFVEVYVKGGCTHWFQVHHSILAEAHHCWPDHQLQAHQSEYAMKAKYEKTGTWF